MSSGKKPLLKRRQATTTRPKQLEVTGSRVELFPARKIPATPLTESAELDFSNGSGGGNKLLLTLNTEWSGASQKVARRTGPSSSGKGWSVAVSASRELYDDSMIPSRHLPFMGMVPQNTTFTKKGPPLPSVKTSHGSSHPLPGKVRQGALYSPSVQHVVEQVNGQEKPRPQKQERRKIRSSRYLHSRSNARKESKCKEQATRTKYLQRKYGFLWCHRAFGRVLPSMARRHYTALLKRKLFGAWQEKWWVEHREWKLGIRAECHNRYRCWIMVWKAWTRYTQTCQAKKKQKSRSDSLYSGLVLRRAWRGWRVYWERRRGKREEKNFCREWHVEWLKRRCWLRWLQAHSERVQEQAMQLTALHYWAAGLERRVLLQWRAAYHAKRTSMLQLTTACRHAEKKSKQVVMKAWCEYVQLRRQKLYLRGVAVGSHNSALLLRCFAHWKTRFLWNRELAQFENLIQHKSRLSICRRALSHWKFFIAVRRHEADVLEMARQQHALTLKAKGMQGFRHYLYQQRRVVLLKQQAVEFGVKWRLQQCWGQWLQRCEHNEEIALGPLTRRARDHMAVKLYRKVMVSWVKYVIHRRKSNRLKLAADTHFMDTALPKCFQAFKVNLSISKYKRELKVTSVGFRRETLLSMVFYKWWRESQLSQDVRMLERVAILHWEEVAKRHWLQLWRARCRMVDMQYQQEEVAAEHSLKKLLRLAFVKWTGRTEQRAHSHSQLEQATGHHALKLEGTVWRAWRTYVTRRGESCIRKASAMEHYQRVVLRKMLDSWKCYHEKAVVKSRKERAAVGLCGVWLQRRALLQWREGVRDSQHAKQLHQAATAHHTHRTLHKHLVWWREVTVASKQERAQEDAVVFEAGAELLRHRVSRVLYTWKAWAVSERCERQGLERAAHHHHSQLKHKLFGAWYQYHQTRRRKRLLSALCEQFRSTRILCGAYVVWKQQLMSAVKSKQRGVVSLWHWSHVLEQKVLRAWLLYAHEKRRKTERYALAMERHRKGLLELGVRQWIKVATHWRAQREEMALNIQAQNTQKVLRCVRRCALHWRELARKHRPPHLGVTRLAPPPPASTIQGSASVWTTLARQLNLPDGVSCVRPQPRRPFPMATPLSDTLPRLLPPPLSHTPNPWDPPAPGQGTSSLDVTAEHSTEHTTSQTSLSTPRQPLPSSHPFRGSSQPASLQPLPSSHFSRGSSQPLPPPAPATCHPLREKSIHEEVLIMREHMQKYLQLKLRQRSLQDALGDSTLEGEERLQLQGELGKLQTVILQTQPILKEVAVKTEQLLQFYS